MVTDVQLEFLCVPVYRLLFEIFLYLAVTMSQDDFKFSTKRTLETLSKETNAQSQPIPVKVEALL